MLADKGYFHRLGRAKTGRLVYGMRKPRKGTQPQIEHDLIGARWGVHIDTALAQRGMTITDLVSDQAELRQLSQQQGWQFVPDRMFKLNGVQYFCEWDNDIERDDKIITKVEAYKSYMKREQQRNDMIEKLGEKVNTFIRVLWVTVNPRRAKKLAELMEGNLCWVVHEEAYLWRPAGVLAPIWVCKDSDFRSLLE